MTDTDLDHLVARANRFDDEQVARLPLSDAEADLLEEIVSTPAPVLDPPARHRTAVVLAAAAVAAVLVLGLVLLPRVTRGAEVLPAGRPTSAAATADRVLLDAPGWRIANVQEYGVEGEIHFEHGRQGLAVHWRDARLYQRYVDDRKADGNTSKPVRVLGRQGIQVRYRGTTDFSTILPADGPAFFEIRGDLGSEAAYRALVTKLRVVDRDTWTAALPDRVVTGPERIATMRAMLTDIPVPAGFEVESLADGSANERYHVGARLTGAVTCAWIHQWETARASGDTAGVTQAVDAMKTSRSWKILREMQKQGAYPDVIWEDADQLARGVAPTAYMSGLGCR